MLSWLYRQLNYLHFVFDLHKSIEELKKDEKSELKRRLYGVGKKDKSGKSPLEYVYEDLQNFVKRTLDHSAYSHIDLKKIFDLVSLRKG